MSKRRTTSQERIEDLTFEGLIKRYTQKRQWNALEGIFLLYGHVLEERNAS